MLNSKTGGTIAAEMLMIKASGWAGPFVLLEGIDDVRFWRAHLVIRSEAIVDAQGVRNLQQCMRSLPASLVGEVCAIADTDFRQLIPNDHFVGCTDTFFYDEGFLETFLLNSTALRKIVEAHADSARLTAFLAKAAPHTVFSRLRHIGSVYARIRVLNEIYTWGISIERDFSPHKYVDEHDWQIDEQRLLHDLAQKIGWTAADLSSRCESVGTKGTLILLHGHDALKILSIGLNKRLGQARVGSDRVMSDLRLAFESVSFRHKRLYKQLRQWSNGRPLLRAVAT